MADDELDELYWVRPEDFTEARSRLATAAKERGDAAGAKGISASRKPTTAAWVVNRLALSRSKATQRLTELGERLREAHAAMDGGQIRELSAQQRRLIDDLSRAAFDAAEVTNPSSALREDVTATLQAAIADPEVAARLGRLAKAERWSGFGDFGFTAPKPARENPELDQARAALAEAERAKSEADAALSEAERGLRAAEDAHEKAKQASRDAAELVKEAKTQLKRART
jgi:hypothetical protein